MPVTIRELVIRTSINEVPAPTNASAGGGTDKHEIIQAAVDKVLDIIGDKNDR